MTKARDTAEVEDTKLDKAGDTMTGQLTMDDVAINATTTMTFETGDTERWRIDNSGNLDNITAGSNGNIHLNDQALIRWGNSDTAFIEGADIAAGGYLRFSANNEHMRITSDGHVGIGETSPDRSLHISSPTDSFIILEDSGGSLGTACQAMLEMYAGSSKHGQVGFSTNAGNMTLTNEQGNLFIQADTNDAHTGSVIIFTVDNSEGMRLNSNGRLLVGKTVDDYNTAGINITEAGTIACTGDSRFAGVFGRNGNNGDVVVFRNDGTEAGSVEITGSSSSAFRTSSDVRLKEDIEDAVPPGDIIDAIKVRTYRWKADGRVDRYGTIAQELHEVCPEAVGSKEDPEEMWSVGYEVLVPMLIKEIQELRQRVAQLEEN